MAVSLSGCIGGPAEAPVTTGAPDTASPSGTMAPSPSDLPAGTTPSPTAMPPATAPSTTTSALRIFYVAPDDRGKAGPLIGCGDSIVATETGPVAYTNQVAAAMRNLLGNPQAQHGQSGLMNALAASDLSYVSSSVSGDTVTVKLSGDISSGGVCEDPRIEAQLTYTAMVAAGTGDARILVNGIEIGKLLSQK